MRKDPPSRKKKTPLIPRGNQKVSMPSFSDGPTASCSGDRSGSTPRSNSQFPQLSDSDSD